jgi:hypothetical protein
MKKRKLYVFGDSFGAPTINNHGIEKIWPTLLAAETDSELYNGCIVGGSQDFAFWQLYNLSEKITKNDIIILVLSHPNRMWYVPDDPSLSYSQYVKNLVSKHGKNIADAASMYESFIQNPYIDAMRVDQRLAWLSYTSYLNGWRSPVVIDGFYQERPHSRKYQHINFSNGNLTSDVSALEVKGVFSGEDLKNNKIYQKVIGSDDFRFNHLILSNHKILVKKLLSTIENNSILDLTSGFIKHILDENSIKDKEFSNNELNIRYQDNLFKNNFINKFKLYEKF